MQETVTTRCPACRARGLQPTDRTLRAATGAVRVFALACSHCGLLVNGPVGPDAGARLEALCRMGAAADRDGVDLGCDIYTLRTIATRFGLAVFPADAAQAEDLAHPHGAREADARLSPLLDLPPTPVTLGILCCEGEADAVRDQALRSQAWAQEAVMLVDRAAGARGAGHAEHEGFLREASRPLNGDFAAQRNALQGLCRTDWMFQLDADEEISEDTGRALTRLATLADRQGIVSIGLARRNRVDGRLSDLYPDLQYRLNRREVVFAGRVHERPVRPWQKSFIALCGDIEHHLTGDHVARRSTAYERLQPGGGRLFEAEALGTDYSPG